MRKIIIILGIILLAGFVYVFSKNGKVLPPQVVETQTPTQSITKPTEIKTSNLEIIAENLDTPWGLVFLPDKSLLVTERPGRVRLIDAQEGMSETLVADIKSVKEIGEGGLLGIALHPDFSTNNYVYLYYTYSGDDTQTFNKVVRMTYRDGKLEEERTIVDKIPGAPNHNGGRIKFGPDNYLYITTGDAQDPSQAQNINTLGGKILRVTDTGDPAPGNPFNNIVYSYGHRNPQGLAWDEKGQLWATEHGPSGGTFGTGNDEINKIEVGKNYGWPIIQGSQTLQGMETPIINSTPTTTWAPSGAAFYRNSLFFAGLRGETLYEAIIENDKVIKINEHLKNQYGRLREVVLGPDKMLYITTSNRDGRGTPRSEDDKIIRINPQIFQ